MSITEQIIEILDASTARAEAAISGPWRTGSHRGFDDYDVDCMMPDGTRLDCLSGPRGMFANKETADFVAAARTDLPARDKALRIAVEALALTRDAWKNDLDSRDALDVVAGRSLEAILAALQEGQPNGGN